MKKNCKALPKIFQLSCHIEGVIPRQGFRLIPANKFLVKGPTWNTDVPSHQMYITTGLKPCWSLTHNWLSISEIPLSQSEEAALGTRMCVTRSCPSNTAFHFLQSTHAGPTIAWTWRQSAVTTCTALMKLCPDCGVWFHSTFSVLTGKYITWFSLSMLKSLWESLFSLSLFA